MESPLIFVTGFGPFEAVRVNPSAEVAEALAAHPPAGIAVAAAVLPTSFARSAAEFDRALASLGERRPELVLSLGVQSRSATGFRLEGRAARLEPGRVDVDERDGATVRLAGGERRTSLDLTLLASELERSGAKEATVSDDAGGYVCERIYHHALATGEARGVPALFLHLPPAALMPIARQVEVVTRFLPALARHAGIMRAG